VSAQVLVRKDTEGLVVRVALGCPQRSHLRNRVNFAFKLLVDTHEVFLTDIQTIQNVQSFISVLADITEDGFSEVLYHVFSLSLLPFLTVFIAFKVAIFRSFFRRAINLALKLHVF
jgi:hypothetical protein